MEKLIANMELCLAGNVGGLHTNQWGVFRIASSHAAQGQPLQDRLRASFVPSSPALVVPQIVKSMFEGEGVWVARPQSFYVKKGQSSTRAVQLPGASFKKEHGLPQHDPFEERKLLQPFPMCRCP